MTSGVRGRRTGTWSTSVFSGMSSRTAVCVRACCEAVGAAEAWANSISARCSCRVARIVRPSLENN